MNKGRQDFIKSRIRAGQIRIVTPEELKQQQNPAGQPAKPAQQQEKARKPRDYSRYPINRHIGKPTVIHIDNGQVIDGVITEVWQYEIIVTTATKTYVVLKHAISTIEYDPKTTPTTTEAAEAEEAAEHSSKTEPAEPEPNVTEQS